MRWMMIALAASAATLATTAQAEQRPGAPVFAPVFAAAPVGDAMLAELRGGQSPFARLTRGAAVRLADDQARADLRWTGDNARIQMDVWWGTIGAELAATSVRAAGAP